MGLSSIVTVYREFLTANGYLTTETDPGFSASPAAGITDADRANWNTAHQWGDHGTEAYLKVEEDPKVGDLAEDKWCRAQGGKVVCETHEPAQKGTGGGVKVGDTSTPCTQAEAGTIRWSGESFQGCDGTDWKGFGGSNSGTLFYTRCAWTTDTAVETGTCTPPECPSDWDNLGITGNITSTAFSARYGDEFAGYSQGGGYSERGCHISDSFALVHTRCAWQGETAVDIESCTPPDCPDGWSDLGITGNIKTTTWGQPEWPEALESFSGTTGYSERTCIK